jgi:predicted ABC-type ATPase
MPNLYIIAGHNGAGKSTFGKNLLPQNAQNLTIFDGELPNWFTEFLSDLI